MWIFGSFDPFRGDAGIMMEHSDTTIPKYFNYITLYYDILCCALVIWSYESNYRIA